MRQLSGSPIWTAYESGGPFIGSQATVGRVTYTPGWSLRTDQAVSGYDRGPVRYFTAVDQDPSLEVDVPNIKSIQIDRSMGTDTASCTITIFNQMMRSNADPNTLNELGQPGYLSPTRGDSTLAAQRWDQTQNEWHQIFTPNQLLTTYFGYGDRAQSTMSLWTSGNIVRTGVWLIDEVRVRTDGMLEVQCRDVGKLLVDQQLYPPLIPYSLYPLSYANVVHTDSIVPTGGGAIAASSTQSGSSINYSFDNNAATSWISGGKSSQSAFEWIEMHNTGDIDTVAIHAWAGNYALYVCIHDADTGQWVGEGFTAAPDGTAFMVMTGVPFEADVIIPLGDTINCDKVRLVFTNLWSGNNAAPFFCGIREYEARKTVVGAGPDVPGNFDDWADIIKELVLWSGWHLNGYTTPTVFGNIENTGIPGSTEEVIVRTDMFDKRPVIDAINEIKDIVGYETWVDEDGGFHFESRNDIVVGQNFDETGATSTFVPDIDERIQLTDYQAAINDRAARSEIIVGNQDPNLETSGTTTVYTDKNDVAGKEYLRGMTKPAIWLNEKFTNGSETLTIAEAMSTRIGRSLRQGSVTCILNPCIGPNDQARIWERQSGDAFIHYITGVNSNWDAETGVATMTLTTHWMDDQNLTLDPLTNF